MKKLAQFRTGVTSEQKFFFYRRLFLLAHSVTGKFIAIENTKVRHAAFAAILTTWMPE